MRTWTRRRSRQWWVAVVTLALGLTAITGAPSLAEEPPVEEDSTFASDVFDAITKGKPHLDVNLRWENAKADTFQTSNALTVRTRLGYETRPLHGLSGLLEFENVATPLPSGYFDAVESNDTTQTIIADPENTEASRFWLNYENPEWMGMKLKTGRQYITLDDQRWVGWVMWRQGAQTYDAVRLQSDLGDEKLLVQYAFVWDVNRVFGDQGPPNRHDIGTETHFINVSYAASEALQATAFAYLLDTNDPFASFGSHTFGTRVTGRLPLGEKLSANYQASYAYQRDAASNPVDYDAHYYQVAAVLGFDALGELGVGYEVLGSDQGVHQVVTPYATAHGFNGFADTFLDNGGPRGLRDFYVSVAPDLTPISKDLTFKFIFHQFNDDQAGDNLGQGYDLVTTYRLNRYISFLYKFGFFDGGKNRSPGDTRRNMLQTTFSF